MTISQCQLFQIYYFIVKKKHVISYLFSFFHKWKILHCVRYFHDRFVPLWARIKCKFLSLNERKGRIFVLSFFFFFFKLRFEKKKIKERWNWISKYTSTSKRGYFNKRGDVYAGYINIRGTSSMDRSFHSSLMQT